MHSGSLLLVGKGESGLGFEGAEERRTTQKAGEENLLFLINKMTREGSRKEGEKRGHKHLHLQDHLARGKSSQDSMQSGPCSVAAEVVNAGPRKARRL